jgi:hypothetical protein
MLRLRSHFLPALPALPARLALLAVLPLALAPLAGCTSSSSSATGGTATASAAASSAPASSAAASASASAPASASPAQSATTPASPAATTASPVAAGGGTSPAAAQVFLAEGGDVRGQTVYRPGCDSGCGLSGDGTTALFNMTWTTWNATEAVGAGTEKIDDCNPNCAAGTLHAVAVRVTLSSPVMVCASGKGTWYWTRVTFTWPSGLPAVFSGDNAPTNPFNYPDITAQQATSCA